MIYINIIIPAKPFLQPLQVYKVAFYALGFTDGLDGKESACNAGDLGLISGLGRSPGEGNCYPVQYSGMENSMELVHGVAKSWTRLSDFHFYFLCLSHSLLPKILTIAFNKICSLVLRNDRG